MTVWVRQQLFFVEQHKKLCIAIVLLFFVAIVSFLLLVSPTYAQVANTPPGNRAINFSARLKSASGQPVPDGFYNVSFRLYDSKNGGDSLWAETFYDENGVASGQDFRVKVTSGHLNAKLGSRTHFENSINWDADLWLTMNIGGTNQISSVSRIPWDGEMSPRIELNAVPYAFSAGSLNGKTADDFVQIGQGTQTNSTNNPSISINTTGSGDLIQLQKNAEDIFTVDTDGNITFGSGSNHTIAIDQSDKNTEGKILAISGGDGGEGESNGGNLVLTGGNGSGGGSDGLVVLANATFATTTNDSNCYPGGVLAMASCIITQQTVDSSSAVMIGFDVAGQTATLPDPTIVTPGRILYLMVANDSLPLTIIANVDEPIAVQSRSALTFLWNGSDWVMTGQVGSPGNIPKQPEITEALPIQDDIVVEAGEPDDKVISIEGTENTGLPTVNEQAGTESNVDVDDTFPFQLGQSESAPLASPGTMYYDTTIGKVQCYEESGWGDCGDAPDTFVTISPEYTNAVMNGTDIGIISSDFCSGTLGINDGSNAQPTVCTSDETYNFYRWTTDEETDQTRSIYLTYQLPDNFKEFVEESTSVMGRTDSDNALVDYQVYRDNGVGLLSCGEPITVATGSQTSWQKGSVAGGSDPASCKFEAGDSILFRINLTARNTSNAYVSNVHFIFRNS